MRKKKKHQALNHCEAQATKYLPHFSTLKLIKLCVWERDSEIKGRLFPRLKSLKCHQDGIDLIWCSRGKNPGQRGGDDTSTSKPSEKAACVCVWQPGLLNVGRGLNGGQDSF